MGIYKINRGVGRIKILREKKTDRRDEMEEEERISINTAPPCRQAWILSALEGRASSSWFTNQKASQRLAQSIDRKPADCHGEDVHADIRTKAFRKRIESLDQTVAEERKLRKER